MKVVGVFIDGEESFHAPTIHGDFDTMCGIDANDPNIGHTGLVPVKRGQKIDCEQCYTMWLNMRDLRLKKSDFT